MPARLTQPEIERRFAAIVKRVMGSRADEALATIKRGGDWQAALDKLYAQIRSEFEDEFAPLIQRGLVDSAALTAESVGVAVSTRALEDRAADFARRYTFDLVKGITDTTRERLSESVVKFLQDETIDLKQLGKTVEWLFGGGRGQTIATTEATRAAAQGQALFVKQLKDENPDAKVAQVWATSEDEMVCPVCGALNGTRITGKNTPPAHPNCRCAVRVVVLSVGGKRVS